MAVPGRLPSGYHRDLQLTKEPLLRGLDTVLEMLEMMAFAIRQLEVDEERCGAAIGPDLLVTDAVYRRVKEEGVPFRAAYREAAAAVARGELPEPPPGPAVVAARRREGELGRPGFGALARRIAAARRRADRERRQFETALEWLAGAGDRAR